MFFCQFQDYKGLVDNMFGEKLKLLKLLLPSLCDADILFIILLV